MLRTFAKPIPLALLLTFCTAIPILVAASEVIQIPLGLLPEDSHRLLIAPVSLFLHALAGVLFGVLGPVQFTGVLRRRFGRLHRITGRVFGVAGLFLGLAGMSLLLQVDSKSTALLDGFRGLTSVALVDHDIASDLLALSDWRNGVACNPANAAGQFAILRAQGQGGPLLAHDFEAEQGAGILNFAARKLDHEDVTAIFALLADDAADPPYRRMEKQDDLNSALQQIDEIIPTAHVRQFVYQDAFDLLHGKS